MDEPTRRIITTRGEFLDAVRSAFAQAAAAGAGEIYVCDATFADWPLSEREVIDDLNRWVHSGRRFTLIASDFDVISRRHGRWTQWRRQWTHVVQCRTNEELEAAGYPTLCLVPGVISVRMLDPVAHRGVASHEAVDGLACREAIDAVSQRSTEAFPVTTLGL
jgi:hypothetical protein